jgi:hypothetical protein
MIHILRPLYKWCNLRIDMNDMNIIQYYCNGLLPITARKISLNPNPIISQEIDDQLVNIDIFDIDTQKNIIIIEDDKPTTDKTATFKYASETDQQLNYRNKRNDCINSFRIWLYTSFFTHELFTCAISSFANEFQILIPSFASLLVRTNIFVPPNTLQRYTGTKELTSTPIECLKLQIYIMIQTITMAMWKKQQDPKIPIIHLRNGIPIILGSNLNNEAIGFLFMKLLIVNGELMFYRLYGNGFNKSKQNKQTKNYKKIIFSIL